MKMNFPKSTTNDRVSMPEFDPTPPKAGTSVKPAGKTVPVQKTSMPSQMGKSPSVPVQ